MSVVDPTVLSVECWVSYNNRGLPIYSSTVASYLYTISSC